MPTTIYYTPHPPCEEPCQGANCFEILRQMIAAIERGELSDELILLVDRIPGDHPVRYSKSGLGDVVGYLQGCNFAPDMRQSIIRDLIWELDYMRKQGFDPYEVIDQIEDQS